jgi:hypothetical protein
VSIERAIGAFFLLRAFAPYGLLRPLPLVHTSEASLKNRGNPTNQFWKFGASRHSKSSKVAKRPAKRPAKRSAGNEKSSFETGIVA